MAEDDDASEDANGRLAERLEQLERVLQANTQRLHAVEQYLRLNPPPHPQPPRPQTQTPPQPPPRPEQRRPLYESIVDEREQAAPPPTNGEAPPSSPPPRQGARVDEGAHERASSSASSSTLFAAEPEARGRDLESLIGGSWFNWVGIIAFAFTAAFFLKHAFENDWIGPGARVVLGALAGLGILFFADRLRARGYRQYAYVLSGGGVLILYLSVYAARNFYELVSPLTAFALMTLVTTGAVLLSVRYHAFAIAVLGLIGGFLTPVLISTGQDNQVGLFTYVALLDAGVLALAYFKGWRSLDFMSFAGTTLVTLGWLARHYDNPRELWPTVFFLTLFFLMFAALSVAHNVAPRRKSRWHDILVLIANATFYFGTTYGLLDWASYDRGLGSFALVVSIFFLLLFYAAWERHRADRLLIHSYAGAAVTFFTMAVAIQTDQHWVTIGWAAEGLMLVWVGLRADEAAARHAALAVFSVALLHWFGWDVGASSASVAQGEFVPLLNRRALSCAALAGALAASAWLHRRESERVQREGMEGEDRRARDGGGSWISSALEEHAAAATLYTLAVNALGLALLTLDINDYFEQRLALAGPDEYAARRVENARSFSLTALWTIYSATMFALGVLRRFKALRYVALALLVLASLRALVADLAYYAAPWHVPVLNQTFMAFALLVAAYAVAVRLYERAALGEDEDERAVVPVLVVVGNLLALVALSAEAVGYFEARAASFAGGIARERYTAEQLALSLVWALYGGGLLLYGYLKTNRLLRLLGLLLLSLTTIKVFFLDLAALDRVSRIISFAVLGTILLAVSYLYQKRQKQE